MQALTAWIALLVLGVILIIVGITGTPGSVLGAFLTPANVAATGG